MKIKLLVLIVLASAFLAIGCTTSDTNGSNESNVSQTTDPQTSSQPDAAELYTQVTGEDDYKGWAIMPGTAELDSGTGVHGDLVTIYVSDDALAAIENKTGVMPNGSIILKEGYNSDEELQQIVIMQKVDGFDPEHDDWYWAAYSPDGEVVSQGSLPTCYDCHSQAEGNDYIYKADFS